MKADSLFVVDLIQSVLDKVSIETGFQINYQYGLNVHILGNLKSKDESVTLKNTKYPLFAVYMPFREVRGAGYYCDLTIRKIVIATLTNQDDTPQTKYLPDGTFKSILYPVYESFLKFFCTAPESLIREKDKIIHTKEDFPGYKPMSDTGDYIDTIQLENFQTRLKQIKYC